MIKQLIEILRQHSADEELYYYESPQSDYWHWGITRIRSWRIAAVADLAASVFPGDIAEIGCERGLTTIHLAAVAKKYGRKVIAVDPWDTSAPACFEGYYEEFLERMSPYSDLVKIVRLDSRLRAAKKALSVPLCFAFVDGLHTYKALLSDLLAVQHAGIIAADDVQNNWEMLRAFVEGAGKRRKIAHPWCKERYIL